MEFKLNSETTLRPFYSDVYWVVYARGEWNFHDNPESARAVIIDAFNRAFQSREFAPDNAPPRVVKRLMREGIDGIAWCPDDYIFFDMQKSTCPAQDHETSDIEIN